MLLAFKSKFSPIKSITWKDRFDETVAHARAILSEKRADFQDKSLEALKIGALMSQEQLSKLIQGSLGSTMSYIENDYYAEQDEARRAILAPPPFEGPALQTLFERLKNKTQEEKFKAYAQFYLDEFSQQSPLQVIRSSYGYNPGLMIQIKDKKVKKPGGLRNQMANDIVARLIKIDAGLGPYKQFEYVNNSVQSTVDSVDTQIVQVKNNEGVQEDIDMVYSSNIDTMDLRMLRFLNTPEQKSLWQLCVTLDKVAEHLKTEPTTQDLADLVTRFVDENLAIRPSSFQEQRAQLTILIDKIKNKCGLDHDHRYAALVSLETLLKEKIKIPAGEEELKALFVLSKLRALLVDYHAMKVAKRMTTESEAAESSAAGGLRARRNSLMHSAKKNMDELRKANKLPFVESAIEWIDNQVALLRSGQITGKALLELASERKHKLIEISNLHQFLYHCEENLNLTSTLSNKLNMMFNEAEGQWKLTNTLIRYADWGKIQTIETIVSKAMTERVPLAEEDLTLLKTLSNTVKHEADLSEFMKRALSTHLFKHYERLISEGLQACQAVRDSSYNNQQKEVYTYGLLMVMSDALKQMIVFSKQGIGQRSQGDETVDGVAELYEKVSEFLKDEVCVVYPNLRDELVGIGYRLRLNSPGTQLVVPDYDRDFLPLEKRLNTFKPRQTTSAIKNVV